MYHTLGAPCSFMFPSGYRGLGLSHVVAALLRKYHCLALHIVKLLEVIPKSSTVVLFSIYHIIRNRSVD